MTGKNYYQKKKVQSSGRPCFLAGSNYNRKKLRPEKERYSHLADGWNLCFLAGSNYNRKKLWPEKKRYSRLDDGWNKSQITVCRVKIQTPIITKLEKKYDLKKKVQLSGPPPPKNVDRNILGYVDCLKFCLLFLLIAQFNNNKRTPHNTSTTHNNNQNEPPLPYPWRLSPLILWAC